MMYCTVSLRFRAYYLYLCSYVMYMLNFRSGEEATNEKNAYHFFDVSGCAGGEDLCLDQNLPRTRLQFDWPLNYFQSRRQCVLDAGHEILFVAKRL